MIRILENILGLDDSSSTITRPESPRVVRETKSKDFESSPRNSQTRRTGRTPTLQKKALHNSSSSSSSSSSPLKDRFQIVDQEFAKGAYGKVLLAIDRVTHERVVIKQCPKTVPIRMINNEVRAGRVILPHPNIAGFRDYQEFEDYHELVIQFVDGLDLFAHLETGNFAPRSESEVRAIMLQILGALRHIHSHSIVHRDLKLENILIDRHGHVTLIDFGLCAFVEDGKFLRDWCGSDNYLAPEVVRRYPYDGFKSDIFSAGVVLFSLMFGVFPFDSLRVKYATASVPFNRLKVRFPIDVPISAEAKDLISRMLSDEVSERISLDDIFKHPFMTGSVVEHSE